MWNLFQGLSGHEPVKLGMNVQYVIKKILMKKVYFCSDIC